MPPRILLQHRRETEGKNADILRFVGFDDLDAVGPYETVRSAGALVGAADATVVSVGDVASVEAGHGAGVQPYGRLADISPDVLIVPGGGGPTGCRRVRGRCTSLDPPGRQSGGERGRLVAL